MPASCACERSGTIAASIEKRIWNLVTDGTPVVVTSHVNLDGDGVGAVLALWHGLRSVGVECVQYHEPPMPSVFEFLPGLDRRVKNVRRLPKRFHLVAVDSGTLDRTGALAEKASQAVRIVNIDHHRTNDRFGHINYVVRDASSSGELIYKVLEAGGVPLTPEISLCLYTAIVTDTGRFSYSNTTREAFEICGRLMKAGVCPWELCERLFGSPPDAVVRLMGLTLGTLKLDAGGRVATMEITDKMFRQTGTHPVDTQGFADMAIAVQGVAASALLKEITERGRLKYVKMSLRSRPGDGSVDVCAVAETFCGGGHRHAAGCEFYGTLAQARKAVVAELRRHLRKARDSRKRPRGR